MTLALLLATSLAADHYDTAAVAAASRRFAEASAASAPAFSDAQRRAGVLADALNRWEVGLDLLGDAAPAAEREAFAAARAAFGREKAVLQAFAQSRVDGYDAAFQAAVRRALVDMKATDATECSGAPSGPRLLPGFGAKPAEACPGADLSARIADHVDGDAALARDLSALSATPWPTLTLPSGPGRVVGAGPRALSIEAVAVATAPTALRLIEEEDEARRLKFQAAIEAGADVEARRAMLDEARAITAATAAARAALTADLRARWRTDADRGRTDLALCARPAALGGCGLPEASPHDAPAPWLKALQKAELAAQRGD